MAAELPILGLANKLFEVFFNFITGGQASLIKALASSQDEVVRAAFEALTFPTTGKFLLNLLNKVFESGVQSLKPELIGLMTRMTGSENLANVIAQQTGFDAFVTLSETVGTFFFDQLTSIFAPPGTVSENSAQTAGKKFIGLSLLLGTNAWINELLADVLSIGHLRTVGNLPLRIAQSTGVNRLTRFVFAPLIDITVGQPLKTAANRHYLPNKLTQEEVMSLFLRGFKDAEWFADQMLNFGFDPDHAQDLQQVKTKQFTLSELKRLHDHGIIADDQYKLGVKRLEFADPDIPMVITLQENARAWELQEKIANEAITRFAEGHISQTDLTDFLNSAKWNSAEQQLAIQFGTLKKLGLTLSVPQLLEMLSLGLLASTQVIERLERRGYTSSDAQLLVQAQEIKDKKKIKPIKLEGPKLPTQAEILKGFRDGLLSEEKTREMLTQRNLAQATIDLLIEENKPKPPKP